MENLKLLNDRYKRIYSQIQNLLNQTENRTARMATVAALLHHKMPRFFWTGFYILNKVRLVVGPYQGPLACLVLEKNKGVCWSAIQNKKTLIVPNVHEFPGHIACDSRSNSEIVVPLWDESNKIWAVLDVDSQEFDAFSSVDKENLEEIVKLI